MEEASINYLDSVAGFKALLASANNNLLDLILRAAIDEKLRAKCLARQFEGAWKLQWSVESENPQYVELLPREFVPPFFGCAVSVLYNRGHKDEAIKYLEILASAPYFNFHALSVLTNRCISHWKHEKENTTGSLEEMIGSACSYATTAADHHHAPGYLLFAQVNFRAAQALQDRNKKSAWAHYENAYKHLLMAQKLEPHCSAAIQRAYLGQGIKASNQWGIGTIAGVITQLLDFLRQAKIFIVIERAEAAATWEAETIIGFYYPPSSCESNEEMTTLNFFN